jgi:UDP-N-acetylglucosamine 2-epimerase (non-hydrolysing)
MREVTERPEGVEAGGAELAGTHPARIEGALAPRLDDAGAYARMARPREVLGDGRAGERMAGICAEFLRALPAAKR